MGYDLNVYVPRLDPNPIPEWMLRLNAYDHMVYELHPDIKFDIDNSGFCPIKVSVPGRGPFLPAKDFMSGFDMSLFDFDYRDYFDLKNEDIENEKKLLSAEGFELDLWENFRFQIFISFKTYNKFEAKLAFLSAAILTEKLVGICSDPQTGEVIETSNVFFWAKKKVEQYERNTQNQELLEHRFEGWL